MGSQRAGEMKKLPPALRKRKRYIAFEIIAIKKINSKDLIVAIRESLLSLFGDYFSADAEIWLEYFNGRQGILRCNHTALNKVKIALTLVGKVKDCKVIPLILGVSGTIKKCKRKYLRGVGNASSSNRI